MLILIIAYHFLFSHPTFFSCFIQKRPAIAERPHSFHIISPGTFSVKLSLLRLSFPFPSWHSPVLPPALAHPPRPPAPDGYRYSALHLYRYAPSDTGVSLDSCLTSPYCCSKCGGRHTGDIRHLNPVNVFVSFYHMFNRCSQCIATRGSPSLSANRNPVYPSTTLSYLGASRSSMMAWKHRNTPSDIGSFLVPTLVFVDSITSRISEVLCSWWSMFMIRFFISRSFSVRPQNSEIRIPV